MDVGTPPPTMIAAVVLAAGTSSRMGRQKLLLPMAKGRPLIRLSVERVLAGGLDEVVVVLGPDAEAVGETLAGLPVRTVVNSRYAEGQSTSLRAGLDALPPEAEAVVVALGDQPLPDPTVIGSLVAVFRHGRSPIVVPRYREGRGHPVLFAASLFDELRVVTGDQGGRGVIARDPARVAEVPIDAPMPADVDTWADYGALVHPPPPR
ncbi:MAG: nucleotidyltransferase family protein [Candidatus Rokuibacteriota bacterium]